MPNTYARQGVFNEIFQNSAEGLHFSTSFLSITSATQYHNTMGMKVQVECLAYCTY